MSYPVYKLKKVPNTMMIKFRNTHITNRTVFWSGRFNSIASFAFVIFFIHDLIIILFESINIFLLILFGNLPWWNSTSFIINPKTYQCHEISKNYMIVSDISIRHKFENSRNLVCNEPWINIQCTLLLLLLNKIFEL